MENAIKITCPQCQHEFYAEDALKKHLDLESKEIRSEFESQYKEKEDDLKALQTQLLKKEEAIDKTISLKLNNEKAQLRESIKSELDTEYEQSISKLKEDLQNKQEKIGELKGKEIEIEKLKRELKQNEQVAELKYQKMLNEEADKLEESVKKQVYEDVDLKMKEKDKKLADYEKQVIEMKRKIEQGSIQTQGEVLEVEIENFLKQTYTLDEILEVPKGVNGADVIHTVKDRFGNECGKIIIESKRTKNYSDSWIPKLKQDQMDANADISILVTQTMPKEMQGFGLKDGIYVCTFEQFSNLMHIVRQYILDLYNTKVKQTGVHGKMENLYTYLTSNQFKNHIGAVLRGLENLKDGLNKEKKAFTKIWAMREKELDLILEGAQGMHGSIEAISGDASRVLDDILTPLIENGKKES